MKTISELNSTWWYRLIKVIYLLYLVFFIITAPAAIFFSYSPEYDNERSYIKCANGRSIYSTELDKNIEFTSINDKDIKLECLNTKSGLNDEEIEIVEYGKSQGKTREEVMQAVSKYQEQKSMEADSIPNNYDIISTYSDRNWVAIIGFSLLSVIGSLFLFEMARRIFYYVILGNVRPKNKS